MSDGRVGPPAVLLELLDDRLRHVVENEPCLGCPATTVIRSSFSPAVTAASEVVAGSRLEPRNPLDRRDRAVDSDRRQEYAPRPQPSITRQGRRAVSLEQLRNFVNGQHADPLAGRTADVIDPSTEEPFATAPVSGPEDVDAALQVGSDRVRVVARHDPVGTPARHVADRRRDRAARRRPDRGRGPQHRQARRSHAVRGDAADGGSDPVLRRCGALPRRTLGRRVHGRDDVDDPP